MPSDIINSIGQASGGFASFQAPANQTRGSETAATPSVQLAQTKAAAEVTATQVQSDQQRTIRRDTARTEGAFRGQERPKDSPQQDSDTQEKSPLTARSDPGKLNRVA